MYEYYRRLNRSINDCYKCISCGSQTGSPSSSDYERMGLGEPENPVSIPNGQPILFRLLSFAGSWGQRPRVSIPNGKPILFRPRFTTQWDELFAVFQSQTGSPSSSDSDYPAALLPLVMFQSQTGSPSSSDLRRENGRDFTG